ncbi:hypothetical protein TrLO_g1215 [Triparma laevis f. longispina]|uniref:Cilia- and flagella-associated protein 58 central coiled coil domain-containing protein n=1 Tax=Triparma laevis f. longispina TaxID=1714387 RepID=A0A9W7FU50_9STRA|nr:hypothetical protein TrLO_g1215 [Triparma laevis f. longispina]
MVETAAEEKKEETPAAPKQEKAPPPVLKVDLDSDPKDSVAFTLLGDWVKRVPEDELESYKLLYVRLWESVKIAFDEEKRFLKKARTLNNDVLGEKINMEKARLRQQDEQDNLERLERERETCQTNLDEAEHADTVVKYELQELTSVHNELEDALLEMKAENERNVEPELNRLRNELKAMQDENEDAETACEKDKSRQLELASIYTKLENDQKRAAEQSGDVKRVLLKAQAEPERIRKQAESVGKAVDNLSMEVMKLSTKIENCDEEITKQKQKKKEAEEVKKNLNHKLELHRDTIDHRQRDVEAVGKNLELEKAKHHQLATQRLELELARKETDENIRHKNDNLSLEKKQLDIQKRLHRKKRQIANTAREVLPGLKSQVHDNEHLLASYNVENKRLAKQIEDMDQEVSIYVARFLKQEGVEEDKKLDLNKLIEEVEKNEAEIAQWVAEERKQNKLIAVLNAQREIKAREALRAMANEKETREQVKVKELVILDLTKKCNEVNNRLKEFSALYDVVKNERNNYVNHIQASSQALAEMKEKIKILQNEVEILRNESVGKDKVLSKEKAAHQSSQAQRDSLRLDTNKANAEYKKKQEEVEQQIVEIDKLNSIINGLERDMLRIKSTFETSVEARNFTGVQLIDRNDELCILYEKANLQEQTMKQGEIAIQQKDEDIRMLKLQLAEIQRQIEVTRNKLPDGPELADKIVMLQQELQMERAITKQHCDELEDPGNTERWRELQGDDPDSEQLLAKIQVLEERLNSKKENLLEKELVLEEVTTLTGKLRKQAGSGQNETLVLAQKVNDYQARIRSVTRKMMASVSELSMYQATAMKLQQEKHLREKEFSECKERFNRGQPPSEEAEREWYRLERCRIEREDAADSAVVQQSSGGLVPTTAKRTTAEPRPNAYIPDEVGIPKPYGALAPFKPAEVGSSMRHIRKPKEAQIEI